MGSNPTPGAYDSTPCVNSRHIQPIPPTALSEIISFGLWMQKQGYRPSTIQSCIKTLKPIARNSNLLQPERVKTHLTTAQVSESRKAKIVENLDRFYTYKHITWQKPNYKRIEKLPFIPLESEVDQLIASCRRKPAALLQLIKETGIRAGEAWSLKWTELDPANLNVLS